MIKKAANAIVNRIFSDFGIIDSLFLLGAFGLGVAFQTEYVDMGLKFLAVSFVGLYVMTTKLEIEIVKLKDKQ